MNLKRAATIIIPILLLGVALGLGVYFLFFRKEGLKFKTKKYTARRWDSAINDWACPEGTTDTGLNWGDEHGERQCKVNKNSKFVGFYQKIGDLNADNCPAGYAKTGETGSRACQKKSTL